MKKRFATGLLSLASACLLCYGKITREEYIRTYSTMAVEQMKRTGIPASITLAQGCLESADGNSALAREANNHFGIKCHDWQGETYTHDDETRNECFRKYGDAEESYRDHSNFLRYRDRYAFLFELDPKDYKGWAYGLKKAGYATAPSYPASLIKIIEDYRLYRFDSDSIALPSPSLAQQQSNEKITPDDRSPLYRISLSRQLFSRNGVLYVLAESYDSYESLAREFNLFKREILRFNDLRRSEPLSSGQVVYLQRKKADAAEHLEMHVVESGETMRDIAQRYAVRAKELYRYNNLPPGSDPPPGEVIFLCKPDKVK